MTPVPRQRSATHCSWFPWCPEPAAHEVERHTPAGVTLREAVCDRHLPHARDHGYEPLGPQTPRRRRAEGREDRSRPSGNGPPCGL